MNYIAIKNDSFVLINESSNIQDLINQGYSIYTQEQYDDYIVQNSQLSQEEIISMLEIKSEDYILFGEKLWETMKRKTWAINTFNKSIGNDLGIEGMKTLLSTSDLLQKSLTTGSLLTAKDICGMLKAQLPQYTSVADFGILEINTYLGII